MPRELKGATAVVTGASSGIGQSIAEALLAYGAHVALVSRRPAMAEGSGMSWPIAADLRDDDGIARLADLVRHRFTGLDVLVHSAGAIALGRFRDLPVASLDEQYSVNVRAPFLLTQQLLPSIVAARGQIVFVNSSAGLAARAGVSQYAASKHALKALADSLREEVHADGVRVISVFPGRTDTPMQEAVRTMEARAFDADRCLRPEDVASVVIHALTLPDTAEVRDISIRPMKE